jgi:hypothetical protein
MKMHIKFANFLKLFTLISVSICAGCVIAPSIGSKPSDTPPKLIVDKDSGYPTWDKPGAFGPVPKQLKVTGDQACLAIDKHLRSNEHLEAIGYHPNAEDLNGKAISGGGYYCFYVKNK